MTPPPALPAPAAFHRDPGGGRRLPRHPATAAPTTQLSEPEYADFLANETSGAKEILEKELNKKIRYFAYPYGDFNKQVEAGRSPPAMTRSSSPWRTTRSTSPPMSTASAATSSTRPVRAQLRRLPPPPGRAGAGAGRSRAGRDDGQSPSVITAVLGFTGDPASLETEVRDFGVVRHDFDPETSTVRIYLPRDLIQPTSSSASARRTSSPGQTMVANWHFNYEPSGTARATHEPIAAEPSTNAAGGGEAATAPHGARHQPDGSAGDEGGNKDGNERPAGDQRRSRRGRHQFHHGA